MRLQCEAGSCIGGKPDGFCPVRFRQNRQGSDILSEAGPTQNRRRHAANDHRRNVRCVEPAHQVRERRLKGRRESINHSLPAADEPIARARVGSAPRDRGPAQRHDASHQRRKLPQLGFHRRTPQFPRFSLSHQFPTPEIGKSFFGRDGGHSPLYYRGPATFPALPRASIRV